LDKALTETPGSEGKEGETKAGEDSATPGEAAKPPEAAKPAEKPEEKK